MAEKDNLFAISAWDETSAVARSMTGDHLDYVAHAGDLKTSFEWCLGYAKAVAEGSIFADRKKVWENLNAV